MKQLFSMLLEMKEELRESQLERRQLAEQNAAISKQLKIATRRQSGLFNPSTPLPPKVSLMTHSAYANLHTPSVKAHHSTRLSVGNAGGRYGEQKVRYDRQVDDEDMADMADSEEEVLSPKPQARSEAVLPEVAVDKTSEAAKLAKVMQKIKAPVMFSGETDKEREEVVAWVEDVDDYLNAQFSQLARRYPDEEWMLVRSLLSGAAKQWIKSTRDSEPHLSWAMVRGAFIEYVQGGAETKTLWRLKMDKLVYGVDDDDKDDKDDKKDKKDKKKSENSALIQMDNKFEVLRIKLYPTSSSDPAMNAVVGQLYGNAIRRGDRYLYAETLRFLGTNDEPNLAQWKAAAAKAYMVRQNFAAANVTAANGPNPAYKPRWGHTSRSTGTSVNEMGEGERGEGDLEGYRPNWGPG